MTLVIATGGTVPTVVLLGTTRTLSTPLPLLFSGLLQGPLIHRTIVMMVMGIPTVIRPTIETQIGSLEVGVRA